MERRPDPATNRGEVPALDMRQEAHERLLEAAGCLRRYLEVDPRWIDNLTDTEMDVLRVAQGRGFIARMEQAAAKLDKQERHARRATMTREPYPSISRKAFERVGGEPQ
jgi:hypothetical protein